MNKSKDRRQRRRSPGSTSAAHSCDRIDSNSSCSDESFSICGHPQGPSRWPPPHMTRSMNLKQQEAEDLICDGATTFHGYYENTPQGHGRFYAVVRTEHSNDMDPTRSQHHFTTSMSATVPGVPDPLQPWVALEKPSLVSCFGDVPGSMTLSYWLSIFGGNHPVVEYKSNVYTRKVGLRWLLERARSLDFGLETDLDCLYSTLYEKLIYNPEKQTSSHYAIEQQIEDLVSALTSNDWIDFSLTKNQVLASFFRSEDFCTRHRFFHQLVLSIELYLRLESKQYKNAKIHLLRQLLPKVAWDLGLAKHWLENMAIGRTESSAGLVTFGFLLRSKRRQVEALRDFAWTLKWPNMGEVEYILEEKDGQETAIEYRSADAMTWFSGVVLPGYSMPWLIMNTLIDCDRSASDSLQRLCQDRRNSGFQYRANTYWSWECIVGKVLGAARGVNQVAGWIGPCIYTPELDRIQYVQIRQRTSPRPRLHLKDVISMAQRSDPLGTPSDNYPVDEYQLILPDTEEVVDTVRMEKLSFTPWGVPACSKSPIIYNAAVTFAYDGLSWDIRLIYDVSFISATPCRSGPHVLFYDYEYQAIKIDALLELEGWGPSTSTRATETSFSSSEHSSFGCCQGAYLRTKEEQEDQEDKVLAVEAFGVPDNEVCARAWCAHFGLSAITANIHKTCMACAIREAYAARVNVLILSEGKKDEEVEQVDRRPYRR